jgi:hypothetical protein
VSSAGKARLFFTRSVRMQRGRIVRLLVGGEQGPGDGALSTKQHGAEDHHQDRVEVVPAGVAGPVTLEAAHTGDKMFGGLFSAG